MRLEAVWIRLVASRRNKYDRPLGHGCLPPRVLVDRATKFRDVKRQISIRDAPPLVADQILDHLPAGTSGA